ncbi:SGNH/GDSL hydrolase family protein [Streptomyces sp. NPDC055287]
MKRTPLRPSTPLLAHALRALTAAAVAIGAVLVSGPPAVAAEPSPGAAEPGRTPVVTWAASTDRLSTAGAAPERTYRLIVRTSAGGSGLRIRLSNTFGTQPVTFGRAYAGLRATGAALLAGTNRPLSFAGSPSVTVPPGGSVYSDPLPGTVRARSDLAVSLYVRSAGGAATGHKMALQTSYIAPAGDHAADDSATPYTQQITSWFYLDAVTVGARRGTGAVATLGDSITDGAISTRDTNRRWPDFLARRLNADPGSRVRGVANEGISGNKVLKDGSGESALKRLDRDVLSQHGVRTMVLLEGVNDIKAVPAPTAAELIAGYRQLVDRSHAAGVCVVGATVMPYEGWREWTPAGEAVRQEVNAFIRTGGAFDAVVDFDTAVKDPSAPSRILPAYNSGDHLHPNDLGMRTMADTLDLKSLRCSRR